MEVVTKDVLFQNFESHIDISFWQRLSRKKLDDLKLSTEPVPISASYRASLHVEMPARLSFSDASFADATSSTAKKLGGPIEERIQGKVINTNTKDEFKQLNKAKILNEAGAELTKRFQNHEVNSLSDVNNAVLITYADLKSHHYYYWMAFPVHGFKNLQMPPPRHLTPTSCPFNIHKFTTKLNTHLNHHGSFSPSGLILISQHTDDIHFETDMTKIAETLASNPEYATLVAYLDPCPLPDHPANVLRNLLAYWKVQFPSIKWPIKFLSIKDSLSASQTSLELKKAYMYSIDLAKCELNCSENGEAVFTGWEKNHKNAMAPRVANLKPLMDPLLLAADAVDLNLKLMRWRLLPQLDVEKIGDVRCLLIGAGTLGSQLGRNLMAWGVKEINFVDNGKVSFSNPVRQSLFEYEDAVEGKYKATAAAEKLKKIFPKMKSSGHVLSIPLPNHPLGTANKGSLQGDVEELERLIAEHDVVFLLTDTRESRWLPTLLCHKFDKLCITVALGFSSFLVMRHGISTASHDEETNGSRLGCYFCNDVVAPLDTSKDLTLDQQCTVTRPGLAYISSGIASELLVSLVHHPLGKGASANETTESCLGLLPQQIRGELHDFQNQVSFGHAFPNCTACSKLILDAYLQDGFEFLLKVFENSDILEDVSGLTALKENIDEIDIDWDDEEEN